MSITNNNPFLLNIQSIQGSVANATGLDPITTLRSDVDDIQQMVKFGEKRIAVDVISAYNQTKIQVINDINVQNSVLSINDVPVGTGGTNAIINNITFINVSTSISYGLSTVNSEAGISSLSSIVSYGLSTVYNSIEELAAFSNAINPGVSSLSSIVSYGLSSIYSPTGISSLSSIISYGLSTVALQPQPGVSSLSSIISYGLSSIKGENSQFLGTNTWVAGFYPSSIGGADIYDSNTGNPDTYTVGLAKLDAWIYKNIVDQPTAPSYFGQNNSISSINCYWTNPQQFKIGILNTYSPYISSLHMNLYSNGGVLFSTFSYCDPYIPYSGFTVEGVEFASSALNSGISVYQNPSFSNKNTIRIPININTFNIRNGPYSLDLYFRNYSSNAYKILPFEQIQLCNVGSPSAPQNISVTNITKSNVIIVITEPLLHSVTPILYDYPPFTNYRITLRNTTPAPRRYNTIGFTPFNVFTNSNFPYISATQSHFLENDIRPDSTYTATVSAQNLINLTYGPNLQSSPFRTQLPDQPETLTSITTSTNGLSNTQLVFGNISNVLVYNRNTFGIGGLQFITNSGLGIQSSNNPGSSDTNIASISLNVTGANGAVETNTLNLDGFPIVSATTSNSNVNTIVQAFNIADVYPTDRIQSNFFMSFTANAILRQSYLTASSNSYTFSMRHSNSGFNCNVSYSPFYVDDLAPGAPSLLNIGTSNNSHYFNSGVPTFRNFVQLNFDLSNLARYFYVPGQSLLSGSVNYKGSVLQGINCNIGTTLYTTGDVLQTVAPLSNVTRIKSAFTIPDNILTEANSNGSRVIATVSLLNLNGSSGLITSNLPFYIDAQSIRINQNIIGNSRYASGGGSNTIDTTGQYINSNLIRGATGAQINYNFELPFVGGLFRTGAALSNLYDSFSNFQVPSGLPASSYSNLSNYSLIKSETGIRYATFIFPFNSPNTSVYINKATVTFSNQSGLSLINSNYDSSVVTYFSLSYNGNRFTSEQNVKNINEFRTNISPFVLSIANEITGTRPDFPITTNSRTVSIISYNSATTRDLYIKIGLRMNCNVSFQNISVQFGSNFAPPRPANVTFTNNNTNNINNLTLRWQTPANCNSPLDNYTFNIIPSCNSTHPRRWVSSGSRIIQESYFSNVICNVFVADTSRLYPFTQYEFTGIGSNYDTPYFGQVSLINDAARSEPSNSAEIRTPLPSNLLPNFSAASNFDLNPRFQTYYPFCNAFTVCTPRSFVTNILSNPATNLIIDYFINGSISNAFSINNSNNTGLGLSNYSYTARWFKDGVATPSVTTTFQFSNQLYSNILTSTNRSSTTVNGLTLNINRIQDMYTSGLATGFYLKAYPNLTVNSFSAGRHSNYFTLSNSDRLSLTSAPFYIDDINSAPVIGDIRIDDTNGGYTFICGIPVWNSYTRLTFTLGVLNLGRYYFRSNAISWAVLSNSTTIFSNFIFSNTTIDFFRNGRTTNLYITLVEQNNCVGTNSVPLNIPLHLGGGQFSTDTSIYIKWDIFLNYDIYTPCNCPTFSVSACNLIGSTPNITTVFGIRPAAIGVIPNRQLMFDSYSTRVLSNTLNSNWSNTGCNYGIRVESGEGLYPSIFGMNFNNNSNLKTGQYSNELQLTYGAYRTTCNARFSGASNGYLNYFATIWGSIAFSSDRFNVDHHNYTSINFTGKRYVTFNWFINSNISRRWRSANIAFDFDDAPFAYDSTTFVFPGIDIHYKIVASNDSTPTLTNLTTAWLNANALSSTIPTNVQKITNGHPCGFYYTETVSDTSNLKVYFPSGNYSNVPFNFFVRIGMPMNSNVSLKYCRLSLDTGGVIPGQQQNFSITNANELLTNPANALSNTTMSWTSQNDTVQINSFRITYAAVSNTVASVTYPRRYRPAGRVITDSNNITSNVSIAGVATTSTYLFTPSNYDTFYYGSVIASNVTGGSILASNISVSPTPLPIDSEIDFSPLLRILNLVSYQYNGVIFDYRTYNIYYTFIFNRNLLFTRGVRFISNNVITINPLNVGNLDNITWNVRLLDVPTNTYIKNCNYTFTNNLFGPLQTVTAINDETINLTLSNAGDMYDGDIYKSGFYGIARPVITLSNTNTIFPISLSFRYRIEIEYNNRVVNNYSYENFYVENLTGAPSGRVDVENIGGITFCNISGVSVITSTRFNFWITTSNIGYFFFYNAPITASIVNMSPTFEFNQINTPFYWNNNTGSPYTQRPISNITYFYWSNVQVTNSNFNQSYFFTGTVNNMDTIGVPLGGIFTPYFDFESVVNMNCNLRVNSGNGLTPGAGDFGSIFNNDISIRTTNELQFMRGVYCTNTYGNGGYQNYTDYFVPTNGLRPNYSGLGSGIRYVSFLFPNVNPNNTSNKLDTVTLRLVYINGVNPPTVGNLYNTNTTFQVRLNNNSPSISTDSTAWLNANSVGVPTLITKNDNGTGCLTGVFNSTNDSINAYDTCSINIPRGCGYCNMNLYTRVGFDMSAGIALRRIELVSASNINIPSQFNGTLYINSNGTNFSINLLPNLPIATYCNLSTSFTINSVNFNPFPSQAITSGSNYTFTNLSFSPNACNVFATGSFVIRNNLGTTFYTSNTIQSVDYFVATPSNSIISFSPGVWSSNSNYFVGTIQTPSGGSGYPNIGVGAILHYTVSNDNNSFSESGTINVGTGGSFSFSNLLTSDQYSKRAFFMTTFVQGTMRDGSTRLSSNLIAGSNGILTPPTGHSNSTRVISFNSATGLTLIESSNFYNSQIFTLQIVSTNYGFQSFSNAGFPRSIYGFCNDPNSTVPFESPNELVGPTFPFTVSCNLSVYDTFYNAYLYLGYTDGGTVNTCNFVSTARTGLPPDTRSNLSGASLSFTDTAFPHRGVTNTGTEIDVFQTGSVVRLVGASNIAVNSTENPGHLTGCNYNLQIVYPGGSYPYTFSNPDYSGRTYTFGADANNQLVVNDYTSCNYARGFYLSFNLNYSNIYNSASGDTIPYTTSFSLNGVPGLTDSRYIDAPVGQITVSIGSRNYTSNVRESCPISVINLESRTLIFTNTFNQIKPFIFGNLSFSYNSCNNPSFITNNLLQTYSIIQGQNYATSQTINTNTFGLPIFGNNSIVNYTMSASYSNLATTCNTSVSDSVFNDITDPITTNPNLTLSNGNLKWILGAWRADYSELNFNSTALQGTFGNSGFVVGPGTLRYVVPFTAGQQTKQFTIDASFIMERNDPTISLEAQFFSNAANSGNGWGTFNCLRFTSGINNVTRTGGCLQRKVNNTFTIFTPAVYMLPYFHLLIRFGRGSVSNVTINI